MRNIIYLCLAVLFITGCGEFAYKRGASAKDFDAAKKTCQSAGNETAVEKCLEDNGWTVQKLDALGLPDSELFANAGTSEDNRNPYQSSATQTNDRPNETTSSEVIQLSPEKESIAATKPPQDDSLKRSNTTTKDIPATPKVAADTTKKEAPTTISPFEKYKINSWWKMGGGRDALELSMAICTKKLGDAHQPDRKNQIFTRAYAACMYENGWRGLREK